MGTYIPNITPEGVAINQRADEAKKKAANNAENEEQKFDEKNYLNVRLGEKEEKKELTIRLLPMDLKTGNPFLRVQTHNVKVPTEVAKSGWKSYICLSKTDIDHDKYGDKCPFCEMNKLAYSKAQEEKDPVKKKDLISLSCANIPRETVIVRCIDRDHEDEGVKFWKFNISLKEDDPYNQIMNLYNTRVKEGLRVNKNINILDLKEGYDLVITISKGGENTKGNTITITDAKFSSPLSNSEEQMLAWVYDDKKWDDVFKVKTYDYLSVISMGEIPWFDKNQMKWVPKTEVANKQEKKKEEVEAADNNANEADNAYRYVEPQPQDNVSMYEDTTPDEDLPF